MKLNNVAANQTEVELRDGTTVLFSYKTPVACWKAGAFYKTEKSWSRTTSKHIGQFLARHGAAGVNTRPQDFFDNLGAKA